ncbi:hypothetical protein GCM10007866_17310 [Gluconobacter albidus]|nr:hypothetical protein GCM10007866_17310 [Gluconobacter albidus]
MALRLRSRRDILAIQPDWQKLRGQYLGVVGAWDDQHDGADVQFEVRAFVGDGQGWEDPVTGSLNAAMAQWLIESGVAPAQYVATQGTTLHRAGRVFVVKDGDDIWIGGNVVTRVAGVITL